MIYDKELVQIAQHEGLNREQTFQLDMYIHLVALQQNVSIYDVIDFLKGWMSGNKDVG